MVTEMYIFLRGRSHRLGLCRNRHNGDMDSAAQFENVGDAHAARAADLMSTLLVNVTTM